MTRRTATRTALSLLFGIGCYAIYRGAFYTDSRPAPRPVRLSAAASFFQPMSEDDPNEIAYQEKSVPMAATIEKTESEHDAATRVLFRKALAEFEINREGDTPKTIAKLKEICPDRTLLARLFKDELEFLGALHPEERDRLIWLANSMQNNEMVAFWQDLALRQTQRFAAEASVRNPDRPTMDSRAVDVEQLQAIRNLGLIKNSQAMDTLVHITLQPDKTAHRLLHREQAFLALSSADPAMGKKILSQLSPDDELYQRINKKDP